MRAPPDFSADDGQAEPTLRFTGNLSLAQLGDFPHRLSSYQGKVTRLDLSGIERIDTIGAWLIHRFAVERSAKVEGLNSDAARLLAQVADADQPVEMRPDSAGVI
ncbi:MAG: ABC transporter permease, partial [Sphingomonas sp.]